MQTYKEDSEGAAFWQQSVTELALPAFQARKQKDPLGGQSKPPLEVGGLCLKQL